MKTNIVACKGFIAAGHAVIKSRGLTVVSALPKVARITKQVPMLRPGDRLIGAKEFVEITRSDLMIGGVLFKPSNKKYHKPIHPVVSLLRK